MVIKIKCFDSYEREKSLSTHPISNPLRIRLANGTLSMARNGVTIEFNIGSLTISQEFIVTLLSGTNKIILGYKWLKEFIPFIDYVAGTLRMPNMETAIAIVTKRNDDVEKIKRNPLLEGM